MEIGKKHAGKMFVDICGHPEKVVINEDGWGDFYVADKSVSVWIAEDALSKRFPTLQKIFADVQIILKIVGNDLPQKKCVKKVGSASATIAYHIIPYD